MKVVVLYRPNSEHGRLVEEFIHTYQSRGRGDMEVINIDSREGGALANLYDIMEYPAILVLRDDGSLQKHWTGSSLPLADEIAAYARG